MKTNNHLLKQLFSILCFSMLSALWSTAQISVMAKSAKAEFIAFEKANIYITITNRAGQPVQFKSSSGVPWIEFIVENYAGTPIHRAKNVSYKGAVVATGKSVTSAFTLNQAYDLSKPGNYSAYAIVRMPGQALKDGFRSNKVFFTIINGYVTWKQKAGVPGGKGDMREYRILNVTGKDKSELYVQVKDVRNERMLATYTMGRNLSFRKFNATTDGKNNLHVLFLTSPKLHCHTVVNTKGKTIYREYHMKSAQGLTPKLITTNSGVVGVVNSTIYDPKKIQEKRRQIHNLSELPVGL